MGVSVVAVSPETGGSPRELKQLHDLSIPIPSDVDHALAKELDFAFPASRPLLSRISAAGVDLAQRFGSHSGILPASASFAIDRDGTMLAGSIESADRFDFSSTSFARSGFNVTRSAILVIQSERPRYSLQPPGLPLTVPLKRMPITQP